MSLHELTDEQRSIREVARRFAEEEIAPHAAEWDREHRFPHEVFEHLGQLGLMGVCVVRGEAGGVSGTRREEKLGLNSSDTAALSFEEAPCEPLGEPGAGMRIALSTLDGGRIGIAAQAVGIAQAGLDLATEYAKQRHAFGRPIGGFQAIQHKLA